MADTLTLQIDPETAEHLRRAAAETGESVEALAKRILEEAAVDLSEPYHSPLTDEQLADLDRRLKEPGPFASPERVEEVLGRFRPKG